MGGVAGTFGFDGTDGAAGAAVWFFDSDSFNRDSAYVRSFFATWSRGADLSPLSSWSIACFG